MRVFYEVWVLMRELIRKSSAARRRVWRGVYLVPRGSTLHTRELRVAYVRAAVRALHTRPNKLRMQSNHVAYARMQSPFIAHARPVYATQGGLSSPS